nr:Signal transduction histidine-protein kinase [Ipomoea batatas]GME16508.1 Signal transduction histidine-protein kinase [Ipomoea batatas]
MDCRVCASSGDAWLRLGGHGGGDVGGPGPVGDAFSHESDSDLAAMVRDFLESGSIGTDSRSSSDSDSSFSDLPHLADKLSYIKLAVDQYESDLLSLVSSLLISINDTDLHAVKSGPCKASCIKYSLVKLLRLLGYDAGVCSSKWQGNGKVPAGDYEYVDVIKYDDAGGSERVIIDINFHSHFEIARAVQSYDRILNSLPVVYVGYITRLKQFLEVMVEAAKSSLKQNSMPLPPWRSYAYLQAKWGSPCKRKFYPDHPNISQTAGIHHHVQCLLHLKQLKSALQSEIDLKRVFRPINSDNRMMNLERSRHPFRAL